MNTRVLILAPTVRDAEVTLEALRTLGLSCVICNDFRHLLQEAESGVATVLLTDESFSDEGVGAFIRYITLQASWSDLPVVLLMRGSGRADATVDIVRLLGNVTLLERPAPMRSVASAVQVAVRSRMRQYQIRDQIEQLHAADEEKKRLLEREKAFRNEAERASRLKDEFLATLSHELRTPLNAILGWSQVLTRSKGNGASLEEGLAAIERNARSQAALISDLLDMSRIISGKVRIEMQPVDPGHVVQAALDTVRPSADAKGVKMRVDLDPLAGPITGDPSRLQQVIWNLLTNAIKFTPRDGRITIHVQHVESGVEIIVADTGQGIEPEFLPHVFERFRQADASSTRAHGGLGLGLSIVKQLVEMHGGRVSARSEGKGAGAAFTVWLPLVIAPAVAESAPGAPHDPDGEARDAPRESIALDGLKILVVDDEPDARALARTVFEQCRAEVVTAGSAREGLLKLDQFVPDVIVSDIGMPHQDGYDFLTAVRARGILTPAIALTAFARSEDRLRTLRAGFQNHISKPVEPTDLVTTVASITGRLRLL
jgi:signal transduction histidine kinase